MSGGLRERMRRIDRGCLNKRRYDTKEAVEKAISGSGCKFALASYKCRYGDHWHMKTARPIKYIQLKSRSSEEK